MIVSTIPWFTKSTQQNTGRLTANGVVVHAMVELEFTFNQDIERSV
jgi:hypothetical protein